MRTAGKAAAHSAGVAKFFGSPWAVFCGSDSGARAGSMAVLMGHGAANPAADLVQVAVCTTPSFRLTWYVPDGNTVTVGAADPAARVLVPAPDATQDGRVNPGDVWPYDPLERREVYPSCAGANSSPSPATTASPARAGDGAPLARRSFCSSQAADGQSPHGPSKSVSSSGRGTSSSAATLGRSWRSYVRCASASAARSAPTPCGVVRGDSPGSRGQAETAGSC